MTKAAASSSRPVSRRCQPDARDSCWARPGTKEARRASRPGVCSSNSSCGWGNSKGRGGAEGWAMSTRREEEASALPNRPWCLALQRWPAANASGAYNQQHKPPAARASHCGVHKAGRCRHGRRCRPHQAQLQQQEAGQGWEGLGISQSLLAQRRGGRCLQLGVCLANCCPSCLPSQLPGRALVCCTSGRQSDCSLAVQPAAGASRRRHSSCCRGLQALPCAQGQLQGGCCGCCIPDSSLQGVQIGSPQLAAALVSCCPHRLLWCAP